MGSGAGERGCEWAGVLVVGNGVKLDNRLIGAKFWLIYSFLLDVKWLNVKNDLTATFAPSYPANSNWKVVKELAKQVAKGSSGGSSSGK